VPRFAAFLRGINVGGHRVTNEELRGCLEAIGLEDVRMFRASGNVVFTSAGGSPDALATRISEQLETTLGYGVAVFVRTAAEIRTIARSQPFAPAQLKASAGKLQVALLGARPSASARKGVLALATPEDLLAFGERELYWLPSGNMSDSALALKSIEGLLGAMTLRTENTVAQIASRHFAD
jgi:uncharacterized protein (DUF1697 family)